MAICLLFFFKLFLTEKLMLIVDSAASDRRQAKLTCFIRFAWPSLEAEMSILMSCFLLDIANYPYNEYAQT